MESVIFFAVFVLIGQFIVNQSQLISRSNQSQSQSNLNQDQLVNQFNVSQNKSHLNVSQNELSNQLNLNQTQLNVNQSELTDQSNVNENQLASQMNVNGNESEIQNQNETCFCKQKTFIGLIMTHPLAAYCISEFTARVHVKGEQVIEKPNNSRLKVYNVFVEHIYKGSNGAKTALNDSKLYTIERNACELNLIVNKTYVVTGWALLFGSSFKAFSYDCFYYREIGQINQEVRQGIEGRFKCP